MTQAEIFSYLDEAEYDLENFADRGGCYRPRLITLSEI